MQKANFLHGSIVKGNLADLRQQDAKFCRRLREAIDSGMEICPTAVNTTPGHTAK
jgi:hypothetical protein